VKRDLNIIEGVRIMADKKNKATRRSIRKQRWAAVVAVLIAVGMPLSSVLIYFDFAAGGNQTPEQGWDLEDYLEYVRGNITTLEQYLQEHEPTVAVLESLAENYNNLILFQQMLSGDEQEITKIRNKLVRVYQDLIELAPAELRYRVDLIRAYTGLEADDETILAEALLLSEMLRATPQAAAHMQLINLLAAEELEKQLQEEVAWLSAYLEERIEENQADNTERYYLAFLLAEHRAEIEAARIQLELILETEEEGSSLYNEAKRYRDALAAEVELPGGAVE